MIKETSVKIVKQTLICDKCGKEMVWDRITLTSYPAQYRHFCECGNDVTVLDKSYPSYEYKEKP